MPPIKTILLVLALLGVAIGFQFRGDKERQKTSKKALITQCNAGAADACEELCAKGDMPGCYFLGVLIKNGQGVPKDLNRAAELFEKSCAGEFFDSCYSLATMYNEGLGVSVDMLRAADLYKTACKGGIQPACDIFSNSNTIATPPPPSPSIRCQHKDAKACKELCSKGDMGACTLLGLLYRDGRGVTRDMSQATQLLNTACSGASAEACYHLAVLYDAGKGVEKDRKRAAQLYEKACSADHAIGCRYLAVSYEMGQGVESDVTRARDLFALACKLGDKTSCGPK